MRVPCNGNQEQPSKLRQHSAAGLTKRNEHKVGQESNYLNCNAAA